MSLVALYIKVKTFREQVQQRRSELSTDGAHPDGAHAQRAHNLAKHTKRLLKSRRNGLIAPLLGALQRRLV